MKNIYGQCRDQCRDAEDFYVCVEKCRDQPVVDLVTKHFGEAKGKQCYGFNKMLDAAAWKLKPDFVTEAEQRAKSANVVYRPMVKQYNLMPVAPYPPNPQVPPRGVINAQPDLKALLDFMKSTPCYKYQLLAKAREHEAAALSGPESPAPESDANIRGGLTWKGWIGIGLMGYAVIYFARR